MVLLSKFFVQIINLLFEIFGKIHYLLIFLISHKQSAGNLTGRPTGDPFPRAMRGGRGGLKYNIISLGYKPQGKPSGHKARGISYFKPCLLPSPALRAGGKDPCDIRRENIIDNTSPISEHRPIYNRLKDDESLGYYLAGLIEGDGWIGDRNISIAFHIKDIKNAYYLKKRIGYGEVKSYSYTDQAIRLVFMRKPGRERVYNLINGKLLGKYKRNQLIDHHYDIKFNKPILPLADFNLTTNYWLAGFFDADGSFGIDIAKSKTHKTGLNVKLTARIKQKNIDLLLLVKRDLEGNIYMFNKKTDKAIYSYNSTSFKVAKNIIKYFDEFLPLNNNKYNTYLKWRYVFLLIQNKIHLNEKGLLRIRKIKENLRD